jgi:hypothetical protein
MHGDVSVLSVSPTGKARPTDERVVRTSLELSESLWLRAKRMALEERSDLRTLIVEGLELVLRQKEKAKRGS